MTSESPTLGALIRSLRSRQGWTLKEMSVKSGIPVSTLSKVEHGQLTLTYDKLYQLSQKLGMRMSELFAEEPEAEPPVTARRSLGDLRTAVHVQTANYDYHYLCAELRRKQMIPVMGRLRTKTLEEFGDLVHHSGEEFSYVIKGTVVLHTEFYDPVVLHEGQSIYFDSSMGHAYLVGEGCEEVEIMTVMTNSDEGQDHAMIHAGHSHAAALAPAAKTAAGAAKPAKPRKVSGAKKL